MVLLDMRFTVQFKRSTLTLGLALATACSLIPDARATTFLLGADIFRDYTYGSTTVSAAPYNGPITAWFLSQVQIFVPDNPSVQLSMTAVSGTQQVTGAAFGTPEPGSIVLFVGGLVLIGLGRFRRRRRN